MEFVVVAIPLLGLIFTMVDAGVLMMRSVMLERGLDIAAREIRLGYVVDTDQAEVKRRICEHALLLVADCEDAIRLELTPFADTGAFIGGVATLGPPRCPIADTPPAFGVGGAGSIMVMRACLVVDPFFLGFGSFGRTPVEDDASGTRYAVVKQTAFMREPR